jgi:signal transduction histidine kinase
MSVIIKTTLAARSALPSLVNGRFPFRLSGIVAPQQRADSRSDEIAAISHELRNSLAVVRNASQMLRHPNGVEGARTLIERHVAQMTRHIDDLLDASHRDVRQKRLQRSHVDLRTIIEFSVSANALDLARRGHHLAVHLPLEPVWMAVDASRLEQVFSNLLINAAKYTPDGGEIALTVERLDASVSIRIRDSGIGIEASVMRHIFDMFVQADATAPCAEGGSGIGLAVVRDLVEMHGGTVCAASAGLGQGSEFTVLLPALWAAQPSHSTGGTPG